MGFSEHHSHCYHDHDRCDVERASYSRFKTSSHAETLRLIAGNFPYPISSLGIMGTGLLGYRCLQARWLTQSAKHGGHLSALPDRRRKLFFTPYSRGRDTRWNRTQLYPDPDPGTPLKRRHQW
jgi:hypothetical protein